MENPTSKLIKKQSFTKTANLNGETLTVKIRYDDDCGNGHNSFAITGELRKTGFQRVISAGCLHDEIPRFFPEYAHLIQWHMVSSDAPLHYIANTIFWAEQGNLEYARRSAVWPEASLEDLLDRQKLEDRLPDLLHRFKATMESLGFTY